MNTWHQEQAVLFCSLLFFHYPPHTHTHTLNSDPLSCSVWVTGVTLARFLLRYPTLLLEVWTDRTERGGDKEKSVFCLFFSRPKVRFGDMKRKTEKITQKSRVWAVSVVLLGNEMFTIQIKKSNLDLKSLGICKVGKFPWELTGSNGKPRILWFHCKT